MIHRKAKHIAAIDKIFVFPYWLLLRLTANRVSVTRQDNTTLVVKLVGMGGIIFLGRLCDEHGVDKTKLTLITFDFNLPACRLAGFETVKLIRARNPFYFIADCISSLRLVQQIRPQCVVDYERSSYAVGTFSRMLAIAAGANSISFHAHIGISNSRHEIIDPSHVSYHEMFLHGISRMTKTIAKTALVDSARNRKILININAGIYLPERRYPLLSFVEVIKTLCEQLPEYEFYLTGSRTEASYVSQAFEEIDSSRIHLVAGKWTLEQLAAEIRDCALCITNDSGPLHIAVKAATPTVAIWGPTQPGHFGYENIPHVLNVTLGLACSPCFLHVHSRVAQHCEGRIDCFKDLSPARVVLAATTLINKYSKQWQLAGR